MLGAVYNPVSDEMFYAEQGKGAYLNGEKLPIKEHVPALRGAMANVDLKRLRHRLAEGICSASLLLLSELRSCSLEWVTQLPGGSTYT